MKNWTRADIPADLGDKTYIITGASSGFGTGIAYELAKRGAQVKDQLRLTSNHQLSC
jgi:NAD(P)-dependent dehydrogenase (short-subunit alcohol dehydrogenase family)